MNPHSSAVPRACSAQAAFRYFAAGAPKPALRKVISGGQTGVDRAALDAALALGYDAAGWCPKGRRAEDGRIADRFPLRETASDKYPQRTALNVRDADATLILYLRTYDAGTRLAEEIAARTRKPFIAIDLSQRDAAERAREWLARTAPGTLNVAGPCESRQPGVYARTFALLARLLGPRAPQ